MSKELIGDAKAYIPGKNGEKARYLTIGAAFKDPTDGRISFKIDTLPVEGSGWTGWVNVFERDANGAYKKGRSEQGGGNPYHKPATDFGDPDDDIPF